MVETRRSSTNFVSTPLTTPPRKSRVLQKAIMMSSELDTVIESSAADEMILPSPAEKTNVPPSDESDDVQATATDTPKTDTVKAVGSKSSKRKRKDDDDDAIEFPKSFTIQMISETLKELRIVRKTPPPLIPLCRIMLNQAVRIVSKEAKAMRETLRADGYVMEKGGFFLSITTTMGGFCHVTDAIKSGWDQFWQEENEIFEAQLATNEDWSDLRGKMFLCWDGNHRTDAWMQEIRDRYSLVREMHFSVQASFVQIDQEKESALIRAMKRINELNESGIVRTTLKDILYGVYRMTNSNLTNFNSTIPMEELKCSRVQEVKTLNGEPWYPYTRYILACILYQSKIDKEIEGATSKYSGSYGLEEARLKAEKEIKKKWVTKMGKYLAIVNPDLGTNWVNLVTSRELENKYINLTVEKLYDMTKAKVPNSTRDRWLTWMTSGTAIIRSYNIPANDRDFHEWVKKETWLETLLNKSQETFDAIVLDESITVNHGGDDLQMWLRQFKVKNRSDMFKAYEKHMSATTKVEDAYEIQKASERVCYRYFKYCLEKKYIDALPFLLQQWAKGREETSMYSAKGNHDRKGGLSEWEIRNCPWWIDFPPGKFPEDEEALFKKMTAGRLSTVDAVDVDDGNPRIKRRRKLALPRDSKKEVKKNVVSENVVSDSHGSSAEETQVQEDEVCGIQQVERRYTNVSLSLICADVSDIATTMNSTQESIFKSIRDFGRKVAIENRTYKRNKVERNWGADVVLLDFPTNEKPTAGHLVVPEWNACSKQVIEDAFTIATLCVDDSGFVVCFCGIEQLKILDAAAKKRNLERRRLYFMVHKIPCEVTRDVFGLFENSCYYFIVYTRIGVDVGNINSLVYSMKGLNQNNNVLFHVLAEKDRLPVHDAKQSRYGLEKSTKVMEFILHSFCVTGGFALDLFAGTGSLMEACALKGVHYFGIEKDEVLVQSVLALRRCAAPSITLEKSEETGDEDDIANVLVEDVDEPLD